MSLHIASDWITEALHVTAAHARSTFLLLDLNSKRRDQKFDTSAKIVDGKPVELEQLFSVTSDGCLLAKSKSRELIASVLGVTLESRLSGYVFQRKGKHRMLAFNSEIEITSETNGNWYIEQLLAKPNVAFRCTHLESLLAGMAEDENSNIGFRKHAAPSVKTFRSAPPQFRCNWCDTGCPIAAKAISSNSRRFVSGGDGGFGLA